MEEINVNPEIAPEDDKYIQEMIDKVDNLDKSDDEGTLDDHREEQRLLAGKYKTEEDLVKGVLELLTREGKDLETVYKELEAGIGKPKEEPKKETAQEEPIFSFDKYEKEFEEKGELSEESYNELAKKGIPREYVEQFIAGRIAMAEKEAQPIYDMVGGKDAYANMIDWAAKNLSEEEKIAFNQAVSSSLAQAKLAVEALYARYVKANGKPPQNLIVGGVTSANSDVYESLEQLKEDMSNPKYQTDPAFRKKVIEKLSRSDIL